MFEKNNKRRLYWLMDRYLSDKITPEIFCDEFYYCYDLEIDIKVLTKCEKEIFSELSDTCSRFSKFEADIANYPETYLSEEQLRKKVETAL